jgi:hypothetical protein
MYWIDTVAVFLAGFILGGVIGVIITASLAVGGMTDDKTERFFASIRKLKKQKT